MIKAFAVFWLCWAHFKGICKPIHRKDFEGLMSWQSLCPLVDKVTLYLYPKVTTVYENKERTDVAGQENGGSDEDPQQTP